MQVQESTTLADGWKRRRDGELLRLYVEAHSEAAFAELGRRYANLVYTVCLREIGNGALAEDAAQGVFLLLHRKAATLQRYDSLTGWLYTTSRYIAKNLMRQERRRQTAETTAMSQNASDSPSANPLWERIEPHFHEALNRLKPAERDAVLMRFVQEQSLAEVGQVLGVPENTARMRVTRALEKIRGHLSKAGIAVTLAALTLLLEERAASAAPAAVLHAVAQIAKPSAGAITVSASMARVVGGTTRQIFLRQMFKPAVSLIVCVAAFVGAIQYRKAQPERLSRTEWRRMFAALGGTWQGTIDYANDRDRKRFAYPTTVVTAVLDRGDTLQWTATYSGAANTDITTLRYDPATGQFRARNGGSDSSHRLSAVGDMIRLSDGTAAFQGNDEARQAEVRIRLTMTASAAVIEEQYRSYSQSQFQFRNRFTLRKR